MAAADPSLPPMDAAATLLALLLLGATVVVALALAERCRRAMGALAWAWCLCGSVMLGTALWCTHWVGTQALGVPGLSSAGWLPAALSWLAAIVVAAAAVAVAGTIAAARRGQAVGALLLVAGLGLVHGVTRITPDPAVGGTWLAMASVAASLLVLAPAYLVARLDVHTQARASALSRSLRDANADLQRAVLYDSLTSLPNRRLMFERLAEVARRCDADGRQAALVFVDLDGFKPMNDLFGHGFGDAVLCEVAHRLLSAARQGDTVARLGGDEFVVLLADIGGPAAAQQVALRAVAALQAPMQLGRREVRLSASMGIALYPADGEATKLLAAADAAMYEAKRGGGGQVVFFAAHMEADARAQMELQRDLRLAMEHPERGELHLHYQPKVSARDGRITGVEALLRWRHPERGAVGPAEFIPVAERFGLIDRLGAWVIDEACRQVNDWQGQGLQLRVAVNLSMHQLRQAGLVERVRNSLARHGVPASRLMFEITESAAMDEADTTGRIFDELAALGTELSIDDFGTGYSSLAYLRRLPSRQLKIDRSFVKDLDTCSDALAIVEAVVRLAHALGLAVVAEGVETPAQRDLLRQLNCDELQGYLFARPVPGATLMRWALGMDRPAQLLFDDAMLGTPAGVPAGGVAVPA